MSRDIKPAARNILQYYAGNPSRQAQALQILFDTSLDMLKRDLQQEAAEEVCSYLHSGPASSGMVCRDCANIEIAMARQDFASTDPAGLPAKSREDADLEAEVLRIMAQS